MPNTNYFELPNKIRAYEKYLERRTQVADLLQQDMDVAQIANLMGRSTGAVYADLAKMMHETNMRTYHGLMVAAIRSGWNTVPVIQGERPTWPE